eukprot:SAG11_NODE_23870_length_382_cov_0.469965_1_plen_48_part_10
MKPTNHPTNKTQTTNKEVTTAGLKAALRVRRGGSEGSMEMVEGGGSYP